MVSADYMSKEGEIFANTFISELSEDSIFFTVMKSSGIDVTFSMDAGY
jgi:hypothetical protein